MSLHLIYCLISPRKPLTRLLGNNRVPTEKCGEEPFTFTLGPSGQLPGSSHIAMQWEVCHLGVARLHMQECFASAIIGN